MVTLRPAARVSAFGGPEPGRGGEQAAGDGGGHEQHADKQQAAAQEQVAKNRSSRPPIRSRITPMNHKKAMPANGTRFSAITTAVRRPASVSHVPGAPGWAGTDSLSSTSAVIRNAEKPIPATAAARGVLSGLPA